MIGLPSTYASVYRDNITDEGGYNEVTSDVTTVASNIVVTINQYSPRGRQATESSHTALMVAAVETGDRVVTSSGDTYVVTSVRALSSVMGLGRVQVGLAKQTVV